MTRFLVFVSCALIGTATFGNASADGRNFKPKKQKQSFFSLLKWPRSLVKKAPSQTLFLPSAGTVISQDHAKAGTPIDTKWEKEKKIFAAKHRADLEDYVERRLELAQSVAREKALRIHQDKFLAQQSTPRSPQPQVEKPPTKVTPATKPPVRLVDWNANRPAKPPTTIDRAPPVAKPKESPDNELDSLAPKSSSSSLVAASQEVSNGLSIAIALLMLHVPSIALASLAIGVVQIRRHRAHTGIFFVASSIILGAVALFLFPW